MKQIVLEAYADWRKSIRQMLQKHFPDVPEIEVQYVLILVEGILIYRMNDDLPLEEALKILDNLP